MLLVVLFLKGGVGGVLEGKYYPVVDRLGLGMFGFTGHFTGYTKSLKSARVYAMYSALMSSVVSGNWKRGCTGEEMKVFGVKVCEV